MAGPAQGLKIGIIIGTPMCFGYDVVNGLGCCWPSASQAVLAEMPVTLQDASPYHIPLAAIAPLVSALSSLVLLPAFIAVSVTVTRSVCRSAGTTELPACSGYSGWHQASTPCGVLCVVLCRGAALPLPSLHGQPASNRDR